MLALRVVILDLKTQRGTETQILSSKRCHVTFIWSLRLWVLNDCICLVITFDIEKAEIKSCSRKRFASSAVHVPLSI